MGAMMRSYVLRASLALAVLVLPALSGAAVGPFEWRAAQYTPLSGTNVVIVESYSNTDPIDLGFEFQLYGQTFNQVRLSDKGYLTLGFDDPKEDEDIPAADPRWPGGTQNPDPLGGSSGPGNLIAAWWGHHHCNVNNGVKYQIVGNAPTRIFRAEWRCSATSDGDVTFETQIHIYENSSVIQLHYGTIDLGDSSADWSAVRAGIKNHDGSQFSNAIEACTGGTCRRSHFPEMTVYQYGVWLDQPAWGSDNNRADPYVRVERGSVESGIDSSSGSDVAWVSFEAVMRNISEVPAALPVGYQFYLHGQISNPRTGGTPITLRPLDPLNEGVGLQGWPDPDSVLGFDEYFELTDVPTGQFYLCVEVQSWGGDQTPGNNWDCDPTPLQFGPDLTGSITGYPDESTGKVHILEAFDATVTIRNDGNRAAVASATDPITFTIEMIDERNDGPVLARGDATKVIPSEPNYERFIGRVEETIPPGGSVSIPVSVKFPFVSNNDSPKFFIQARIDEEWTVDNEVLKDANPANNLVQGAEMIAMALPSYRVSSGPGKFDFEYPMGCVLGEKVRGLFEVCNETSEAPGYGFRPSVRLKVGEDSGFMDFDNGLIADLLPACIGIEDDGPGRRAEVDDQSLCEGNDICSLSSCWTPCDPEDSQPNNGCDEGFKCIWNPMVAARHDNVEHVCTPYLEPQECVTYTYEGSFPWVDMDFELDTAYPPYGDIPDQSMVLPYLLPNPNLAPAQASGVYVDWDEDEQYFLCQYPRSDIEAVSMPTLILDVEPGKPFPVERRFRNLGTFATEFEYGYYMGPVPHISPMQWPVSVVGSEDGLGRTWIERRELKSDWTTTDGIEQRFDMLVVPVGTPPGEYYFGMVADPHDKVDELSKTNNTYVYPAKLRVHAPAVSIETRSLPIGTVGVRYNQTLWATGGMGGYRWEKGEGFPAWLDLDPETGHLSGIPTEARDYVLTVRVRSGGIEAKRPFALRVLEPEGRLSIPRHVLPLAVVDHPYGPVELRANGGLPPYTWQITGIDGTGTGMPPGFCAQNGVIRSGRCDQPDIIPVQNIEQGAYRFMAIVTDSRGATDREELVLHVAGRVPLRITTEILAPFAVGEQSRSCISADGGERANYEWTVTGLPPGVVATPEVGQVCLEGVPLEFGAYMINVTVSDLGLQANRMFPLEVANRDIHLPRSHLGEFEQGAQVDERLDTNAQIRIVQGRLPSGLDLTPDNWVRGTISPSAEPGHYPILLELRTEGGQVAPAALGITVLRAEQARDSGGDDDGPNCGSSATGSSSGTGIGLAAVMLGLLGTLRSRRRSAESN